MPEPQDDRHALLYSTRQAELVPRIESLLERAGIPYRTGLQVGNDPRIVFTVAEARFAEASALVARAVEPAIESDEADELDEERAWEAARDEERREWSAAGLPRGPLLATGMLALFHMWIVFGLVGPEPTTEHLAELGGLARASLASEPWRLLTSVFLHSSVRHALWNGLALVVFGVPAIVRWGYVGGGLLYLVAGIGGGLVALAAHPPGTLLVGSSGAVAGLFGAWLVTTGMRARRAPLSRRAWIRAVGLGLLVLPSFLTPVSSDGRPISVAAHLGGMLCGATIALGLEVLRARRGLPAGVS